MVVKNFGGTLNIRCRIIIRTQKGTIILTTTHLEKEQLEELFAGLCRSPFLLTDANWTGETCAQCPDILDQGG